MEKILIQIYQFFTEKIKNCHYWVGYKKLDAPIQQCNVICRESLGKVLVVAPHADDELIGCYGLYINGLVSNTLCVNMGYGKNEKSEIRKKDQTYKLLMVGNGELKTAVENRIKELKLADSVQMIDRIPNSDIWELYRLADSFVNLNQQEIFGMAILEAMYYGCKVVAWVAPGPNLIIENGKSGWLTESNDEVMERILDATDVGEEAHRRILREFTWESSAKKIITIIGDQK